MNLAECLEHLTFNADVATVLGSIPASSDTLKTKGRLAIFHNLFTIISSIHPYRCLFDPGIRNRFFRIPDLGSRIPNPYFWEFFWVKSSIVLWKLTQIFFFLQFCEIYGYKRYDNKFFFHTSLLLLFLDPGSEIRDPGWVKIRIRDPG